jgi:predicted transcriptional regulator of viral defense system
MKLTTALADIKKSKQIVLRTADVMALLDVDKSNASKLLSRLAEPGHVARVKRGLWIIAEGLDPLVLPRYLTSPFPSYVSLQSALFHHGMISQIPRITYCVSLARTRRYSTPLGVISVHHVAPTFFFGFQEVGQHRVAMAVPEKALLDFFYFAPAKSRLFAALPELDLPQSFSMQKATEMIGAVSSQARRSLLEKRLRELQSQ